MIKVIHLNLYLVFLKYIVEETFGFQEPKHLGNVIQAAQSIHHWTPQWWSDTASRDSTVKKKITERNTSPTAF